MTEPCIRVSPTLPETPEHPFDKLRLQPPVRKEHNRKEDRMRNYDAWLEKPYQDMMEADEAYERAEEEYREDKNGQYSTDLREWQEENPGKTEDDFIASPEYERILDRLVAQVKFEDYPDDYFG